MRLSEFYDVLFGDQISQLRRLSIFVLPSKRSALFSTVADAVDYVEAISDSQDVYQCVSLIAGSPSGRGKREDCTSTGFLWCDVDVSSDAHKSDKLPTSKEEATEFINSLPIKPTIIVDSGWGMHGYWILTEPVLIDDEDSRSRAESLTKGWHQFVCDKAAERGWELENLGDLPRVLRTPGTQNNKVKADRKKAAVVSNTGEIYDACVFEDYAKKPEQVKVAASNKASATNNGISALGRCLRYLDKIPGAVQGQSGGKQTLMACRAIFRFGLSDSLARTAFDVYNHRCQPKWENEKEIAHKLSEGLKIVNRDGEFGKLFEEGSEFEPYDGPDADLRQFMSGIQPVGENGNGKPKAVAAEPEPPEPVQNDDLRTSDDVASIPDDLLSPDGLLSEVMAYTLSTSRYPQPEIALAGAVALMSVLTGRKVCDDMDTRTNIYILTVNPARSGKDRPREVNKEILYLANGQELIGPERIGSHAGLISWVDKAPAILFQIDELGRLLATTRNAAKAPHLYSIPTVLMSIYSSATNVWIADAYAEVKKTKTIDQPHAVILGTTTGETLWPNLSTENIEDGLMGRLLIFEGRGYVDFNETAKKQPVPSAIIQAAAWWVQFQPGAPAAGNLGKFHPIPQIIPHDGPARTCFLDHVNEINEKRKAENPFRAAVWSGTAEKTSKLALIHACSRARGAPDTITLGDMRWAKRLANFLTRKMLLKCSEELSENEIEAKPKRILKIVGVKRWTRRELMRKLQWIKSRERHEIVNDMIELGLLTQETENTSGRSRTWYQKPK